MHTRYFTLPSGYVESRPLPEWQDVDGRLTTQHLSDREMLAHYKATALESDVSFYLATQAASLTDDEHRALLDVLASLRAPKPQRKTLAASVRAIMAGSLARRMPRGAEEKRYQDWLRQNAHRLSAPLPTEPADESIDEYDAIAA